MPPLQRILCPVDFSDFSRSAFDLALAIARLRGSSVTVLHVVQAYPVASVLPTPGGTSVESRSPVDRAEVARELDRFLDVGREDGVPVICEVGEAPDVSWEILSRADRLAADLIVMGTHGRSGVRRLLFGSVAEKVLRASRQPVLTVPTAAPRVVPLRTPPFRRILCAVDFSECSMAALEYARSLAEHPDARLTVLHVVEISPPTYPTVISPPVDAAAFQKLFEDAAREELRRAITGDMRQATSIEECVTTGKPHHEIVRVAAEQSSDLIVLGIHGRNPIDRMIFGSTAEPVVRRAECPVLTVRPGPVDR